MRLIDDMESAECLQKQIKSSDLKLNAYIEFILQLTISIYHMIETKVKYRKY